MAKEKGPLLGELEELKAVLHKQRDVDFASIPLLDDIIYDEVDSESGDFATLNSAILEPIILNTDTAIQEYKNESLVDPTTEYSAATDVGETKPKPPFDAIYSDDDGYEREIFMQEVLDAMMPEIEAELRARLLNLDYAILERWHSELHTDN